MSRDLGTGLDPRAARALLDYLRRADYVPVAQRQLLHRMHVEPQRRPQVRALIRRLLDAGTIVKGRGGRLSLPPDEHEVTGTLQLNPRGFGFVATGDGEHDVFIPRHNLGGHLAGDRVVARITRRRGDGRPEGVIVRRVDSRPRRVLGVFARERRGGVVQPFEPAAGQPIRVPETFRSGARDRQVVRVELLRRPVGEGAPQGKVLETLGALDEPGMDAYVVANKYGLPLEFPKAVLERAAALPARVGPKQAGGRRRMNVPPPVTIDGETAKDFDDAIAVQQRADGGFRLFVHIADVAHFVIEEGVLDLEARRRATSVYFPGTVLPMFPERLSNDLCSLRPGVDRLVQTAILDFDRAGERTGARFADGVIHSAARLTYTQVQAVLDGDGGVTGVPRNVLPMLRRADRLRQALEQRRRDRGSLDFDLPEPRILLDVEGTMTGITIEPRNKAHRMIEEFMIAANEAVAEFLEQRARGCMFRVHEPPDPLKLEALAEFAHCFGLRFRPHAGKAVRAELQRLFEAAEDRPEASVIRSVALRSMKQARYDPENIGHFGLASESYCHFTSPIRRYPDLVVHRLLRAARKRGKSTGVSREALDSLAQSCSELERNAEAAERELLNWKKVAFIADQVGEVFEGVVTGVASFGLFVRLEDNLVEGLVRVERLGEEGFRFDERRHCLTGDRSGQAFRLGDRLRVRVERVDRILQRVDLGLPTRHASTTSLRKLPSASRRPARRQRVRRGRRAPRGRRRR